MSLFDDPGDGTGWGRVDLAGDLSLAVAGGDLDGDGDLDFALGGNGSSNSLTWYENVLGDGSLFRSHGIAISTSQTDVIHIVDLDRDGPQDLLVSSATDSATLWLRNDDRAGLCWSLQIVADNVPELLFARAGDLDDDGDIDLVTLPAGTIELAWNENLDSRVRLGGSPQSTTISASPHLRTLRSVTSISLQVLLTCTPDAACESTAACAAWEPP